MRCNATSDNTILLAAPIFVSSRVEAQNKWRKLKWLLPNGLSTADTKARVLSRPRETRGCVQACHLAGERQQSLGACYAQAVEDGDSQRTRSEMIRISSRITYRPLHSRGRSSAVLHPVRSAMDKQLLVKPAGRHNILWSASRQPLRLSRREDSAALPAEGYFFAGKVLTLRSNRERFSFIDAEVDTV
ncbi:hypothetical protein L916_10195 [Phytophthora nicotianae]|uniref:Uncharacterized protein n=1 Tax=Phytophthora nicotianae TaxID=4792 RepID=W2IVP3_PHYNI|nr:hypothetical protein L916_10195 [Phytophthora nicotianae]